MTIEDIDKTEVMEAETDTLIRVFKDVYDELQFRTDKTSERDIRVSETQYEEIMDLLYGH